MPILDDARAREALSHPDADVRQLVLSALGDARSPDTSFLPAVIEAFGRYGRKKAFEYHHKMEYLAQTPATVAWAVAEAVSPGMDADDYYLRTMAGLLDEAEPTLVAAHAAALAAAPAFKSHKDALARRLLHLDRDDDALWGELEALSEKGKDAGYAHEAGWDEMEDIVAVLGTRPGIGPRVLAELALDLGDDVAGHPRLWLENAAARLAGLLRLEAAVPDLVRRLHIDGELLLEECQTSLTRIGTDAAVAALLADYGKGDTSFRIGAACVWGDIRSEAALRACLEWLPKEDDDGVAQFLASGVARKIAPEANDALHACFVKVGVIREARDDFLASCTLLGQDYPEMAGWRARARQERETTRRRMAAFEAAFEAESKPRPASAPLFKPAPAEKPKTGRNDPCPCGSGKKYKKCCIDKKPLF